MKKLTKVLLGILVCVLASCLVAAFVACDENPVTEHTHEWADDFTVDKAATCTAEGSKSIHCNSCDETKEATAIPATGHVWATEFTVDAEATCVKEGSKSKHCTVNGCDGKDEVTAILATGHVWESDYTVDLEPTCTTEGSKSRHCTVDGCNGFDEAVIPANGHSWADDFTVDKAATCTAEGSKSKHCTVDGCDGKDEVTVIPANGHTWATEYTVDLEPTCTEQGSKSKHCTVDGCNGKDDVTVIPAAGHAWDDYTVDVEPTCTTEGSKSRHCTVDGCNSLDEAIIPANGHSWADDYTVDLAPTCTEQGSKSKHCTVADCDATDDVTAIPANGHAWADEYTVDVEPTCTEQGSKSKHCTVDGCDGKSEVTSIPATGHSATAYPETQSTCSVKGHDAYWQCDACQEYFSDSECTTHIDAPVEHDLLAHTYDWIFSQEGQKAATCTEDGYKAHNVCTVCHTKFDINDTALANPISDEDWAANYVFPAKHTSVTKKAVKDPTCTLDGNSTEHYYCSTCKSYAWDQAFTQPMTAADVTSVTITKLGHDYSDEWTIDVEATCAKAGSQSHHCSRCTSKTDTTAIPALPHTWADEYTVDLEPTCQAVGSKSYHCSVCDASNTESAVEVPISADSHAWSHRSFILTPATCVSEGSQAKSCLICGAQQEPTVIPVNPNAHNYSIWWTVDVEPTCTTAGSQSHHCENEGCEGKGSVTEIPALGHSYVCAEGGMATCSGCSDTKSYPEVAAGKTVNNFVDVNTVAGHYQTHLGANLIAVQNLSDKTISHYLDFYADESATYKFTFGYLTDVSTTGALGLSKIAHDTDGGSANLLGTATVKYAGSNSRSNIVSIEIAVTQGETLYLNLMGYYNVAPYYIMNVEFSDGNAANSLTDGQNTVSVTVSGDLTGIDSYTFTPTESKKYSMSIPEGLSVAMNGQDLISNGTYAEFDATKGKAIVFSFTHDQEGDYQIYIGGAAPQILELGASPLSVTLVGHSMTEFHVADDLAPGKYTITFTGNFTFSRIVGAGKLWFQLNGDNDFDSLSNDTALYLQSFATINKEGYECSLLNNTWTVTLELAAGDVIYLAPDASLGAGNTVNAPLYIQLTQAA